MSMETKINELVWKMVPQNVSAAFLSRNEIIEMMHKVAAESALIGYGEGEALTRKRFEKKMKMVEEELTIVKEELKTTQLDLLASSK